MSIPNICGRKVRGLQCECCDRADRLEELVASLKAQLREEAKEEIRDVRHCKVCRMIDVHGNDEMCRTCTKMTR